MAHVHHNLVGSIHPKLCATTLDAIIIICTKMTTTNWRRRGTTTPISTGNPSFLRWTRHLIKLKKNSSLRNLMTRKSATVTTYTASWIERTIPLACWDEPAQQAKQSADTARHSTQQGKAIRCLWEWAGALQHTAMLRDTHMTVDYYRHGRWTVSTILRE